MRKLPRKLLDDPDLRAVKDAGREAALTGVHLIYRRKGYEAELRDFEFSRVSMHEHWQAGRADMDRTLDHPAWGERRRPREGVYVFDLTRESVAPAVKQSPLPGRNAKRGS